MITVLILGLRIL